MEIIGILFLGILGFIFLGICGWILKILGYVFGFLWEGISSVFGCLVWVILGILFLYCLCV